MSGNPSRQDVFFDSHGIKCAAWFYPSPASSQGQQRVPAIVLGHGLGAVKEMGLDRYSEVFQSLGYATLAFDYRHFGGSDGVPRQLLDIGKQRQDWHAALAYIRARPEIDPSRIAIFGSSFGGGHVLEVAKADPKVVAVISQCPFTHGFASALCCGVLPLPGLLASAAADVFAGAWDGTDKGVFKVPLAGKPGSVALLNGHDAWDGYLGLLPKDQHFENAVAARLLPRILFDYPGRAVAHIKVPILFAICGKDSCAPSNPTLNYAKKAQKGKVIYYPDMGHFSIYQGEEFKRATTDYKNFLLEVMPPPQVQAKL